MITLKDFWESEERLAIHCDTEAKAKKLLCAFHRMGKKWKSGKSYIERNNWIRYEKETCYSNDNMYGSFDCYVKHNCKIYEFEEIDDFHFNVGDRVRIRQWQDLVNEFGTDEDGDIRCGKHLFVKEEKKFCGKEYTIVGFGKDEVKLNDYFDGWAITTDMIEKVYEDKKINMADSRDALDYFLTSIRSRARDVKITEEEKRTFIYGLRSINYSFRFNEERQSVTLYKDGEKVQFVKPQENDKFNWKTGLGVCLYKQLYRDNKEVEYVKTIVNEKTFYNYCIAKFFDYDKSKVETLEEHVKNCKRKYCEFQLSKIQKESQIVFM